nr:uncharacterized protein LOC124810933 [Hydra vulgaris]
MFWKLRFVSTLIIFGFNFFVCVCENKFSSSINYNDGKSKVFFVSMKRINNTRLVTNSPLMNINVVHQSLCLQKCVQTTLCTSYNIFVDNQKTFQCQLLSENKYSFPNLIQHSDGWVHASIQSIPCERSPCKNNSTCIPMYTENSYYCNCSVNYQGLFCENSTSTARWK